MSLFANGSLGNRYFFFYIDDLKREMKVDPANERRNDGQRSLRNAAIIKILCRLNAHVDITVQRSIGY